MSHRCDRGRFAGNPKRKEMIHAEGMMEDQRLRCEIHSGSRWAELQWRQQLWRLTIACVSYCEIVIQAGEPRGPKAMSHRCDRGRFTAIQNARK
jgi:hypothetical protein